MAGSAGEIHTGPRGWQLQARCMKPLQKMALPEASLPPGIDLPWPPSTRRHHLYERHLHGNLVNFVPLQLAIGPAGRG